MMQTPVVCKNCGIKWLQIISCGDSLEMIWAEQHNCPKCGSNWCECVEEKE